MHFAAEDELIRRINTIKPRENDCGIKSLYPVLVSARYGAVTHPGAKKEKKVYSDI